ncbi:MAG TPA: hypothetical protein VKV03_17115 [Candidatus Binataceae bacterium]|nr:hypothetical protein [Candidatus Binataceae bacterium]
MPLSARNHLKGEVTEVVLGVVAALVVVKVGNDVIESVDEKGARATYDGVAASEILYRVGAPLGKELRGQKMAFYMLVSGSDGYHAVYAIAEVDPAFTDRMVAHIPTRR